MKKWLLIAAGLLLAVPMLALAQAETTPEAAPETAAESPEDLIPMDELIASLPQSRGEDGAFLLGDPDAPFTLIEFADYACPHCQDYKPVIDEFIRTYVASGDANFEFRQFPTAGGQLSIYAMVAAECTEAQREGAFWGSYVHLYDLAAAGEYDGDIIARLATHLELDADEIQACVESSDDSAQVIVDYLYGEANGIAGTPGVLVRGPGLEARAIIIDGRTYTGGVPLEVIEAALVTPLEDMVDPTIAENEVFMAENGQQPGVTTTASGLQYSVITEGTGTVRPAATDTVTVMYEGRFPDGRVFDSSYERGEPIDFPLNGVIAGFSEGIQLMTVGAKYTFTMPSELAYGARGAGGVIPPNAVLVFDVELLAINGES
ncbi:MAG: FKBP-type peptidyl-prolyl cis-trans isomerase [Pleurocapsa minor GSE-CHR-MK-17-07R]|jgi:FKBP-type peptidyl-prolyl cis-trans isomerase|nr:FKBP-type peptidyl-prolyl cis-trans isomerase [Pleurocapsa minor GSE-CHR-MK 17-07R]